MLECRYIRITYLIAYMDLGCAVQTFQIKLQFNGIAYDNRVKQVSRVH